MGKQVSLYTLPPPPLGVRDKVSQTTPSIPIYVKARKKGELNEGTGASAKGKMQAHL